MEPGQIQMFVIIAIVLISTLVIFIHLKKPNTTGQETEVHSPKRKLKSATSAKQEEPAAEALLDNESFMLMNETDFITNLCINKHVIREKCTSEDLEEICGNVMFIFIALVFAELKHLNASALYNSLTRAYPEVISNLSGGPPDEANESLAAVRYYEQRLFDQDTGEIRESLIWGIFEEINKRAREHAFGSGNCHPEEILKAILDHFKLFREGTLRAYHFAQVQP